MFYSDIPGLLQLLQLAAHRVQGHSGQLGQLPLRLIHFAGALARIAEHGKGKLLCVGGYFLAPGILGQLLRKAEGRLCPVSCVHGSSLLYVWIYVI